MLNKRYRLLKIAILLTIILIGIFVRLVRLPALTMWSDEYHTVQIMQIPLTQILTGQYNELNPPLYFGLLKIFLRIFGNSESVMRSFSLLCAIFSLFFFFLLSRELLKGFFPSIGALLLFTFHPMFIYYSTEIRSYSLLVLLGLISIYSLLKYRNNPKHPLGWLITMTLGLILSLYTHHFGFLILLVICVVTGLDIIFQRKIVRYQFYLIIGIIVSIVMYIPGLLILRNQANTITTSSNLYPPDVFFQVFAFSFHHPIYEQFLIIIAISALILGLTVLITQKDYRINGLFLAGAILASIIATLLAYFAKINLLPRYLLGVSYSALIAVAGTLVIKRDTWINRCIVGIGVLAILLYVIYGIDFTLHTNQENQLVTWKSDWKALSQTIKQLQQSKDTLVITAWDETPVLYYLNQSALISIDYKKAWQNHTFPQYLIIVSINSQEYPEFKQATLLYEDKSKSIKILRLIAN
jgi:uncharacterized membrane protein